MKQRAIQYVALDIHQATLVVSVQGILRGVRRWWRTRGDGQADAGAEDRGVVLRLWKSGETFDATKLKMQAT